MPRRRSNTNVDVVPICGEKLRALRDELGLSMKVLSARAGISRSSLGLIEAQKRHPSRTSPQQGSRSASGIVSRTPRSSGFLAAGMAGDGASMPRSMVSDYRACSGKVRLSICLRFIGTGPADVSGGKRRDFCPQYFSIANVIQTPPTSNPCPGPQQDLGPRSFTEKCVSSFPITRSNILFLITTITNPRPTFRPPIPISKKTPPSTSTSSRCVCRRPNLY